VFFISKLIDHFLLPPGIFLAAAAVLIFLHRKKKERAVRILLAAVCVSIYLFSIEPVRDFLIAPLENKYPPINTADIEPAEAVVCLGGGSIPFSPEEAGRGSLSRVSMKRLVYAYRLADKNGLPVIAAGGVPSGPGRDQSEAELMRDLLLELGFPENRVLTEDESRNTWENARNISRLYGADTIVLVTSAFHMPRSVRSFENFGAAVIPAPTDFRSARGRYTLQSFFPSMTAFSDVHAALREYVGIIYYALRFLR